MLAEIILYLNAVVFGLYGVGFSFAPAPFMQRTVGAKPGTVAASVDIRATYGGLMLAIGILFAYAATQPAHHEAGLWAVLLMMIGMAATRALGMALEGAGNGLMKLYLVLEVVAIGLCVYALGLI